MDAMTGNGVQPEAWARVEWAGASAFSRDGGTLWFLRGSGQQQVWAMDLATGAQRQVTHHDEKVAFLRRAPKDDRLQYGIDAGGDERQQLWLLDGGEARPLTTRPDVIHDNGSWSPDGTALAYAANDRTEAALDVVVLTLATGERRRVWEGAGETTVAGFSPDGGTLAVIAERATFDMVLWLVPLDGGRAREVPRTAPTRYLSVRWTPEGGITCLTDAGGRDHLALCRLDLGTGEAGELYAAPGRDVEAYAFSPDRGTLATIENDRGYSVLRVGPAEGERAVPEGVPGESLAAELAFSPDGGRLAFTLATTTRPAGLWLHEQRGGERGSARPLWQPGLPGEARPFALVEWESEGGRTIPGWLALPAGEAPAGGHPAVVWVHGGPAGQTRGGFRPDMQALLAQGYAVMMPNVRGSTGYGRASTLSDERERRLDSVTDLAHGGRWLAARAEIDADRVAVMGQSYGGYMVLAAITEHPEIWRCAIDFYGIADFRTLLANTGAWRRSHRADEYGDPATQPELMERISPITHVDRIRVPVLALHGTRDPRVPFGESEQIVAALEARGVPVVFERFGYAGHGFVRAEDRERVYRAVAGFLAAQMGGDGRPGG